MKLKTVRLNKFLSSAGVSARRKADSLIKAKKVMVNSRYVAEPGYMIQPGKDVVKVSGKKIEDLKNRVYIAFNKPRKVVSTMADPEGRVCLGDFFKKRKSIRVFPAGRLDYYSEGLILLTNDGFFAETILHPKNKISKTYFVKLKRKLDVKALNRLRKGLNTERGFLKAVYAENMKKTRAGGAWVKIIINEGKNRQLHYMFQALGLSIKILRRTGIGRLKLKSLKSGAGYDLSPADIKKVFSPPPELS